MQRRPRRIRRPFPRPPRRHAAPAAPGAVTPPGTDVAASDFGGEIKSVSGAYGGPGLQGEALINAAWQSPWTPDNLASPPDGQQDNPATATPISASVTPVGAGTVQTACRSPHLLPLTPYSVGVRAVDVCGNVGPVAAGASFTTPDRQNGEVDACFVATAAYGSIMANDVELLRRFRDLALRHSVLGELFVEGYYTFGPPVAGVVGESELLRESARDALAPLVDRVRGVVL